jgi:two-component system sensor histidine kinase RegB
MQDANAVNLAWLIRLRWVAICGQIASVVTVELLLGLGLPWLPLLAVVVLGVASNLVLARWTRGSDGAAEWPIGILMGFDVLLLTALLYFSGGPINPFTALYLVNIALAAVVLPQMWSWGIAAFSVVCYGLLFFVQEASAGAGAHGHEMHLRLHLEGMWIAFGIATALIVYFVQHVTRALAERDAELERARSATARHEKLASLGTLAAGAAHQLATPLSTIAVVSKELEQQLAGAADGADAIGDARLIREQVERCREILVQMAADAGEATGEPITSTPIESVIDLAVNGMGNHSGPPIRVENLAAGRSVVAPVRSIGQAVRAVLRNAVDASSAGRPVTLRVALAAGSWRFEVRDSGAGMTPEVLQHAGEPFFTTKGPNRGMGLGLFLARTVFERLGGTLELRSLPQAGTTVVLTLPADLRATIRADAAPRP